MSALGGLVAGAGGALTGQVGKVATLALAALLLAARSAGGALWWEAAVARDQALADLATEKGVTAQPRAGVNDQNRAIN